MNSPNTEHPLAPPLPGAPDEPARTRHGRAEDHEGTREEDAMEGDATPDARRAGGRDEADPMVRELLSLGGPLARFARGLDAQDFSYRQH